MLEQTLFYILVFGMIGILSASVVWALWWALRGGQFSNFQKGATSIFDADEPVGRVTDRFPKPRSDEPPTDAADHDVMEDSQTQDAKRNNGSHVHR